MKGNPTFILTQYKYNQCLNCKTSYCKKILLIFYLFSYIGLFIRKHPSPILVILKSIVVRTQMGGK